MKKEERVRQHPPRNTRPPTKSSIQGSTDDKEAFLYPRLTEPDRLAEAHRIAQALELRRAHLARLGLAPRDRAGDLALARAVAVADRMAKWTSVERESYTDLVRRALAQGATCEGLGFAFVRMRGEAA